MAGGGHQQMVTVLILAAHTTGSAEADGASRAAEGVVHV